MARVFTPSPCGLLLHSQACRPSPDSGMEWSRGLGRWEKGAQHTASPDPQAHPQYGRRCTQGTRRSEGMHGS